MNPRKTSILDTLVKGSEVPQTPLTYFLEVERVNKSGRATRRWFPLNNRSQKDPSHIPETIELSDQVIIKRLKRTRNTKLLRKIQTQFGFLVEDHVEENESCE
jgi:hypothetical protein